MAMRLADTPPAVVKVPPIYTSPLPPRAMAYTRPLAPVPRADQALPSNLAMLFAGTPPAVVKAPPTYRDVPERAIELTGPFVPVPTVPHWLVVLSHMAMRLA